MIKPHIYSWKKPYNWTENILECLTWGHRFIIRGARGWCYADAQSLDDYLISILIPALTELKKSRQSYPIIDENLSDEESVELWNEKLDIMIKGFEAAKSINEAPSLDSLYKQERLFKKGMREFAKYFFELWD